MVEADHMTPDEVIEWLEGRVGAYEESASQTTSPDYKGHLTDSALHYGAMAQTVRAMRDAAKEAQGVLADLTGSNPERSVLHLWARAVAAELSLRSSLSPKEGG